MAEDTDTATIRPTAAGLKRTAAIAVVLLAAVVVLGLASRAQQSHDTAQWTHTQAIPVVRTISPIAPEVGQTLTLPGTLEAFNNAQIYARVPGYLKAWYRDIGARVRTGELLAVIDTPELDQQIAQAKADLVSAVAARGLSKTTSDRWAGLLKSDAVSKQETDEKAGDLATKSAMVNAAQANLQRLQALKSFARIVAPFDGVVTARNADIGALVNAGSGSPAAALFTVADVHDLRVYVRAPEAYSTQIRPGMTAAMTLQEFPGRTFRATLVSTSGAISNQSGTLLVELMVDNRDGALDPGGYAKVRFPVGGVAGQNLRLPASALMFRREGLQVATLTPSGHVLMKPIAIAQDLGPQVEVATGISTADKVIDNPPDSLANGDIVRTPGEAPRKGL